MKDDLDWTAYKLKLNKKIYDDLTKFYPKLLPNNKEEINHFFESHDYIIKDLFDFFNPNYPKFILKLIYTLQYIYKLPIQKQESMSLFTNKLNDEEKSEVLEYIESLNLKYETEENMSDKKQCIKNNKENEWNLINQYELIQEEEKEKIFKQEKLLKNINIQNDLLNEIERKNIEKKKEKEKLILEGRNLEKTLKAKEEETRKENCISKMKLDEENRISQENYAKTKKLKKENRIVEKENDLKKLQEQENEFNKYHSNNNYLKVSKIQIRDANYYKNLGKKKNNLEVNSILENPYNYFKITKNDYNEYLKEKERNKLFKKEEDKQYMNLYSEFLENQEKNRINNQILLVTKCLEKSALFDYNSSSDFKNTKKEVNKHLETFQINQMNSKEIKKIEMKDKKIKEENEQNLQINNSILIDNKNQSNLEKIKKEMYYKELEKQILEKNQRNESSKGMNLEEQKYNLNLLSQARKTLAKKFI